VDIRQAFGDPETAQCFVILALRTPVAPGLRINIGRRCPHTRDACLHRTNIRRREPGWMGSAGMDLPAGMASFGVRLGSAGTENPAGMALFLGRTAGKRFRIGRDIQRVGLSRETLWFLLIVPTISHRHCRTTLAAFNHPHPLQSPR
jgi:hypothetical protein